MTEQTSSLSPEDCQRIWAAAQSYLGVPWRGQGRDRSGIDCCGVIACSHNDAGFPVEEGEVNYRSIDPRRMKEILLRHWFHLDSGMPLRAADVVVYGVPQEAHIGLLGPGTGARPFNIIHCPAGKKVVETSFDPGRGLIRGYYRWL